jgi:hypothetical protein
VPHFAQRLRSAFTRRFKQDVEGAGSTAALAVGTFVADPATAQLLPSLRVELQGPSFVELSEQFAVTVELTLFAPVTGLSTTIQYDPEVLAVESVVLHDAIDVDPSSLSFMKINDPSVGLLLMLVTSKLGKQGSRRGGTLSTIFFKPVSAHTGTLVLPRVVAAAGINGIPLAPETPLPLVVKVLS